MSRIGKKPIDIPSGVKVSLSGREVTVAGPKHTLKMTHRPEVKVALSSDNKQVVVSIDEADSEERFVRACWGTTRANIANMILGVTKGYEKTLEVVGVGWTAALAGKNLKLTVGLANALMVPIPTGLEVTVDKQFVKIKGPDKQQVGEFAASTRALRKPEPYNGKGVKYSDEVIKRKQGKAFGS